MSSIPATGLADRLKEATADQHRRAEERPLQRAMAGGTIDRETYGRWSAAMLEVHVALERGLLALRVARGDLPGLSDLLDGHPRHVANLRRDVAAAPDPGSSSASASASAPRPAAADVVAELDHRAREQPVSLLGCLYVLEGSMNGNRFIAARLGERWGTREGLSYLDPDGADQRPRWLTWRAGLDGLRLSVADQGAIEEAAGWMFDAITRLSDELAEG